MKPVNGVHDALKLRAVQQIEGVFFPREHFQGDSAGGSNHPGGFFGGQISASNRFDREIYENSKAADATTFVVDFLLRRSAFAVFLHRGPW